VVQRNWTAGERGRDDDGLQQRKFPSFGGTTLRNNAGSERDHQQRQADDKHPATQRELGYRHRQQERSDRSARPRQQDDARNAISVELNALTSRPPAASDRIEPASLRSISRRPEVGRAADRIAPCFEILILIGHFPMSAQRRPVPFRLCASPVVEAHVLIHMTECRRAPSTYCLTGRATFHGSLGLPRASGILVVTGTAASSTARKMIMGSA